MTKATLHLSKKFNAVCAPNLHSDLITIEGKLSWAIGMPMRDFVKSELAEALSLIRKHITLIEKEK